MWRMIINEPGYNGCKYHKSLQSVDFKIPPPCDEISQKLIHSKHKAFSFFYVIISKKAKYSIDNLGSKNSD